MRRPTVDEVLDAHAWRVVNEPLPDGVRHSEEHVYWALLRLDCPNHPSLRATPPDQVSARELRIARFHASRPVRREW